MNARLFKLLAMNCIVIFSYMCHNIIKKYHKMALFGMPIFRV